MLQSVKQSLEMPLNVLKSVTSPKLLAPHARHWTYSTAAAQAICGSFRSVPVVHSLVSRGDGQLEVI